MTPKNNQRYLSSLAGWLDILSYIISYPWLTITSLLVSCFISTPAEEQNPQRKLTHYFVYAPALGIITIAFAPLGLAGYILYIVVCHLFYRHKYIHLSVPQKSPADTRNGAFCPPPCGLESVSPFLTTSQDDGHQFTFCTSNLILAPECVVRFNRNKFVYTRAPEIARRLLWQHNCSPRAESPRRQDHVTSLFPAVDFFCIQEVWERVWALILIREMQKVYPYFLYDVGEHKLNVNGCVAGSGLFFASKYPILEAEFETFENRKGWARLISYGVLCVKVDIGLTASLKRRVGYVANLHTRAYQDRQPIIFEQLVQARETFQKFCKSTAEPDDVVVFCVICGDFNYDNISPGDRVNQNHPLFEDFVDFARDKPGLDKPWTVGTEMRQVMMFDNKLNSAHMFKKILQDDQERRRFLLDANVESQTLELARLPPPVDDQGRIQAVSWGGRRRIDHILHARSPPVRVTDYTFVTALSGLTDHVPVAMAIRTTY